jgi:hypothetical protein
VISLQNYQNSQNRVFSARTRHGEPSWRVNNFWADETRHGERFLASRADLGQNQFTRHGEKLCRKFYQFTRHGEQISRHGELEQN